MATSLTTIRRLQVQGEAPGVSEVATKLKEVSAAQEDVVASSTKMERSTLSMERRLDSLQRRLDMDYRAQQQLRKDTEDLTRARDQGLITVERQNALLDLSRQRYGQSVGAVNDNTKALNGAAVANDNFARRTGLSAFQVQNLSYQINDVGTMLASGSSPFQVLATQGGQIYQILASSERGVIGAIKGMGAAVVGFLGPLGLAALGLTAAGGAAYYFWKSSQEPAKTTEELLEEQVRLLGLIKKGYEDGASAAGKFAASVSNIVRLQEEQNRQEMQRRLIEGTQSVVGKLTATTPSTMAGFVDEQSATQVVDRFRAFTKQIEELQAGLARGVPDVQRFREEVAAMAVTAPGLRSLANELLNMTDALEKIDPSKLQQTRDELERLAQVNAAKGFQSAYESLLNAAPDANKAELQQQKLLDLAQKRAEAIDHINQSEALSADRSAHLARVEEAYRRGVAAITATQASSSNSYDNLIQRTQDRIKELNFEAETADRTSGAVMKLKLMHDLERAAKQNNITDTAKLREEWEKLTDRMVAADRASRLSRLNQQVQFDRQTMFLPDGERQIASSLRDLYGNDVQGALDSTIAAQMRMNQQLEYMRDLSATALKGFLSDLRQGKSASEAFRNAAVNMLDNIAAKLADMAINNLWASAFGGGQGGSGGFNLLSLFGGAGGAGGLGGGAAGNWGFYQFGGMNVPLAIAHTGGVVGLDGFSTRFVHPAYFDDAPRMHTGGDIDWAAGERPIIAQTGERVLNRQEAAEYRRGGGGGTVINNYDFRGADKGSEARLRTMLKQTENRAVQRSVREVPKARSNNPRYMPG